MRHVKQKNEGNANEPDPSRRRASRARRPGRRPRRIAFTGLRAAPRVLKISHQFPGGTADQGDFRDRLVRRFASAVQSRTNGELSFEIYPGSSLMKTVAQFSALRRGALDFSLYPLAYAGGEVAEVNIGLMPWPGEPPISRAWRGRRRKSASS